MLRPLLSISLSLLIAGMPAAAAAVEQSASAGDSCAAVQEPPRIELTAADKAGGFYSDDFKVTGKITGRCLRAVSVLENGEKVIDLPVHSSAEESVQEFRVTVDASKDLMIRASTQAGRTNQVPVDVLDLRG